MGWFGSNEARLSRRSKMDIDNAKSLEEIIQIEVKLPEKNLEYCKAYYLPYLDSLGIQSSPDKKGNTIYLETTPDKAKEAVEGLNKIIRAYKKDEREFNIELIVKRLEERDKKTNYTLREVLEHPIKYSRGGFGEAIEDPSIADLTVDPDCFSKPGKRKLRFYSCVLAAFGVTSVPHELLHAGANKLTGGINHEIAINKFFGGDIIHYFFPEIQSKWMIPIMGGYVIPENPSYLGNIVTGIAPYVFLTPLGVYLLNKAKEKKNLLLCYLGGGLVAGHAGGIIGDFWSVGRMTINELLNSPGTNNSPNIISDVLGLLLGVYWAMTYVTS